MAHMWRMGRNAFDEKAYRRMFRENDGPTEKITTDGILEGFREIKKEILTDSFFEEVKRSPMYITGAAGSFAPYCKQHF